MGNRNSKRDSTPNTNSSPISIGSILETRHEDIFQGMSPSVTLTSILHNDCGSKLVFKGSFVKQGRTVDRNVCKHLYSGEEGVIFAARNGDGILQSLKGTSGVCLWAIEDSAYCLALAWSIPKYRTIFSHKANTITFGLLLDFGRFGQKEAISEALFDELMKGANALKPGTCENLGNCQRFSSPENNPLSNFVATSVMVNDAFRVVTEVSSGRHAKVFINLTTVGPKQTRPPRKHLETAKVKLLAFRRCFCEYDCDAFFRYKVFKGQFCDNGQGYVLALLFESEGHNSTGLFVGCTAGAHIGRKDVMVMQEFADENWDLEACIQHRQQCWDASNIRFSVFDLGQVHQFDRDNVIFSMRNQVQLNDRPYIVGGQLWARDWIRDLSRVLGLTAIFPSLTDLIEADPQKLVNFKTDDQIPASSLKNKNDKALAELMEKHYVPIS